MVSGNSLNINAISRNTPLALVVGAAGFIGSHIVEELLKKNVQVIGLDDFSTGKAANLDVAVKDKSFHLVNTSADKFDAKLPRLDYLVIVSEGGWGLQNLFSLAEELKPKIAFISTIELYSRELDEKYKWFKGAESRLARFATEHKLNVRVIRLGSIYGPRMHFREADPAVRLIQAGVRGEIQKELAALDFSTRAMYVKDAVGLVVKSLFSGGTAWKIYDGLLLTPIKISELREVLLDPDWHENRGFMPSELPPWPTPNLVKTMKELSWEPKSSFIKSIGETMQYFKDREIEVPQLPKQAEDWQTNKIKLGYKSWEPIKEDEETGKEKKKKSERKHKLNLTGRGFVLLTGWLIIILGIFYPIFIVGFGLATFRHNIGLAGEQLERGKVGESLVSLRDAKMGLNTAEATVKGMSFLSRVNYVDRWYEETSGLLDSLSGMVDSGEHVVLGSQAIFEGIKSISGENNSNLRDNFEKAKLELNIADSGFSRSSLKFDEVTSRLTLPSFAEDKIEELKTRIELYRDLVKRGRTVAELLPEIIPAEGQKSYLLLLQNNAELRPTGGFIGTVARVDFDGGKLKKLEVQDVYEVDGHLDFHVEPPEEVKNDLGQKDWFLRDSNFEPDFPTAARQAEWFYGKETSLKVDGTVALDVSAMENLLSVLGPVNLSDYGETVGESNLFEKAITHAEQGFFPGSQAKKNFLTALSTQVLNKVFFAPNQNWPGIIQSVGKSFNEKHLLVYLDSPKLFSYLVSQNYAGAMPRPAEKVEGEVQDLLAVVEANLGANKANFYLDRKTILATVIGKEGEVRHTLRINYTNRSPNTVWPAGVYKNRLRLYLPSGTKLTKLSWGETEITSQASSFVEYGRTGYSILLELQPKEQKKLIAEYELSEKIEFKDGLAKYRLDVIKQAGTINDPFTWQLNYPLNYKVSSNTQYRTSLQEINIDTDLSTDKSFEVNFSK